MQAYTAVHVPELRHTGAQIMEWANQYYEQGYTQEQVEAWMSGFTLDAPQVCRRGRVKRSCTAVAMQACIADAAVHSWSMLLHSKHASILCMDAGCHYDCACSTCLCLLAVVLLIQNCAVCSQVSQPATEAYGEQQPEQHTDWLQDAQADLDPEGSSTAWQDQLAANGHAALAEHADTSSALPDAAMPEAQQDSAQLEPGSQYDAADAEPQSSAAVADLQAIAPSAAAESQASQHNEQTAASSNALGQHTDWVQAAPAEASGWADVGMEDAPAPTPALAASHPEAAQQHGQPVAALSENGHAPGEGPRILVHSLYSPHGPSSMNSACAANPKLTCLHCLCWQLQHTEHNHRQGQSE